MFGVYIAGGISGGHLNPAVTLANCLYRRFVSLSQTMDYGANIVSRGKSSYHILSHKYSEGFAEQLWCTAITGLPLTM